MSIRHLSLTAARYGSQSPPPSPDIQEAWALRRNTIRHLMHRDRPGPHHASLIAELNGLATSLAKAIAACG